MTGIKRGKTKIAAAVLAVAVLGLTGCAGGYERFDLLSEYIKKHPETIVENTKEIFGLEADELSAEADSEAITDLYLKAFAEGKENGYIPVLVFLDDILEEKISAAFEESGREKFISEALSAERQDGKELFDKYYSALEEYYGEELSIDEARVGQEIALYPGGSRFLTAGGRYADEGRRYLVKVPADKPYEIFAWLPFGGWNECPDTEEMISMCQYWYEEYGAVPASITYDTLTFYLDNPVTDKETAIKAAKEQCAFSSELLGMGGIDLYIAMTVNSNVWSFWWD